MPVPNAVEASSAGPLTPVVSKAWEGQLHWASLWTAQFQEEGCGAEWSVSSFLPSML